MRCDGPIFLVGTTKQVFRSHFFIEMTPLGSGTVQPGSSGAIKQSATRGRHDQVKRVVLYSLLVINMLR